MKNITIIFLLLIFCSCNSPENKLDYTEGDINNISVTTLNGLVWGPNNYLKYPTDCFYINDSSIVVVDSKTPNLMSFINTNNGQVFSTYGVVGEAGNNFSQSIIPGLLISNSNEKYLGIVELGKNRHLYLNVDSMITNKNYFPSQFIVTPPELGTILTLDNLNDSICIGTSLVNSGRLYRYNKNNQTFKTCPYFPEPSKKEIHSSILNQLYNEALFIQPNGDKIVGVMNYFNVLNFYDQNLNHTRTITFEPKKDPCDFAEGDEAEWEKIFAIYGRGRVVTNKFIYLRYVETKDKVHLDVNEIRQYNWEGKLLKRYAIKEDLFGLCIDEKNNILYGINIKNLTQPLIKYKLPN